MLDVGVQLGLLERQLDLDGPGSSTWWNSSFSNTATCPPGRPAGPSDATRRRDRAGCTGSGRTRRGRASLGQGQVTDVGLEQVNAPVAASGWPAGRRRSGTRVNSRPAPNRRPPGPTAAASHRRVRPVAAGEVQDIAGDRQASDQPSSGERGNRITHGEARGPGPRLANGYQDRRLQIERSDTKAQPGNRHAGAAGERQGRLTGGWLSGVLLVLSLGDHVRALEPVEEDDPAADGRPRAGRSGRRSR